MEIINSFAIYFWLIIDFILFFVFFANKTLMLFYQQGEEKLVYMNLYLS